jgi:hypothetical protein
VGSVQHVFHHIVRFGNYFTTGRLPNVNPP